MNEHAATRCPIDWRALLLIVSLWIPATLFFGGHLGWWNDDYFFNGRDPATGQVLFWVQTAPTPFDPPAPFQFWRPLNFLFTTSMVTAFWNHDWVVHVIGAVAHLIASLLLYRVLAALRTSKQACLFGTLVFLCCPVGFEAVLWASAIATGVATSMLLGVILLYVKHARGDLSRWGHIGLTLLASAIPLVNEQPAACLAALPLLYLATRQQGERLERSVVRAAWPLLIPGCVHACYVLGISKGLPPSAYGSASSLVPLHTLPGRVGAITSQMLREFGGATLGLGAWREGWSQVVSHWMITLPMGAFVAGALALQARRWMGKQPSERARAGRATGVWLVLFAIALTTLTLLPLAAVGWVHVRPRMAYATTAALAVLLAILGNTVRDRVVGTSGQAGARLYGVATGVIVLMLASAGVVMFVGVGSGYRARSAADTRSVANLVELVGTPGKDSFLLPLAVDNRAVDSGVPRFDWYFASAWYWSYAFPTFARQALGRDDIEAGFADVSRQLLFKIDDAGFDFAGPVRYDDLEQFRGQGCRVFWHDAITFKVGFGGEVTLLSPIRVTTSGALVGEYPVPQVEAARARGLTKIEAWTVETK